MTAQLLDYPTTPRVRVAPARRPGVTVAPHRDAPRRPLGPGQRSWSTTVGVAAHTGSVQGSGAGVGGTAVDLEHLHWTPRALMLMVVAGSFWGTFGLVVINLAALAIPVHMFAQMKGAYSLSIFSALWRTVALMVFCTIVIGLFVTAIIYLGLGH